MRILKIFGSVACNKVFINRFVLKTNNETRLDLVG